MRALYIPDLNIHSKELKIGKDKLLHLTKVLRLKEGAEVLIINGKGIKAKSKIVTISKNEANVEVLDIQEVERKSFIDIAIGLTKKDSFEEIVQKATELGIRKIFPVKTQYSQRYELNIERLERIVSSSIEQSNNPFAPIIEPLTELNQVHTEEYDNTLCFSLNNDDSEGPNLGLKNTLIFIGPEGGFSEEEEISLQKVACFIKLDTPILRAPTALCSAVGYLKAISKN